MHCNDHRRCTQRSTAAGEGHVRHLPRPAARLAALFSSVQLLFCTVLLIGGTITSWNAGALAAESDIPVPVEPEVPRPAMMLMPTTPHTDFAKLKDSDTVELQNGRRLKVGTIRKFSSLSGKLKAARPTYPVMPQAVKKKAPGTGIRVANVAELSNKLQASDDTTIEFPSGRTYTVAQLRFLQPFLEVQLGKKMNQPLHQQHHKGKVVQLKNTPDRSYWKSIFTMADSTVLETPQGTRFTVGELKQFIGQGSMSRISTPTASGVMK